MATRPREPDRSSLITPRYDGPIFDADSHIQERNFDFMAQYTPSKFHEDWLVHTKYDDKGEFSLFLGNHKVDNVEIADGVVFPPGKLKEWLKAIATGEQIDVRIPIQDNMYRRDARVEKLDEMGVEACLLFVGLIIATLAGCTCSARKRAMQAPMRCCMPTTSTCWRSSPSITRTGSIRHRSSRCGISTGRSRKPGG